MKRMVWMSFFAAVGSLVLAQNTVPVGDGKDAPTPNPHGPASVAPATNAVSGKPDYSKVQALFAEMSDISKTLRPQEEMLQSDPEVKTLVEKRTAAQQALMELETQRRDLVDKKLSADPSLAPLVARRRELQQTLKDLRASMPNRRMPSMEGAAPMPMPPPHAAPMPMPPPPHAAPMSPVPAPAADDKPAVQPK